MWLYGFHTVKAIFPDRVAGFAVGTEVGLGVAVGPLLVGVGEGLLLVGVGVGVGVDMLAVEVGPGVIVPAADVDVALVVAETLGVLTMIGVHVGVG